jgi:hypothetical protein
MAFFDRTHVRNVGKTVMQNSREREREREKARDFVSRERGCLVL